jgi:DedD protein
VAKTAVSDEEIQLRKRARRRLVGAIALVLLAVVFLPMVLDSEPKQRPQEVSIQIPPIPSQAPTPPSGQTAPPATDASSAPPRPSIDSQTPGPQTLVVPSTPSPAAGGRATPDAKPVAPSRSTAPQKPAVAASRPADAALSSTSQGSAQIGEGYVVRLAAYADANNAKQLLAKLKANKIAGYSEVVKTAEGQRVRVRAGPFPTEESARSARDRMRQLKLIPPPSEGKIVRQGE